MPTIKVKDADETDRLFRVREPATGEFVWDHCLVDSSGNPIGVSGAPLHLSTSFTIDYDTGGGTASMPVIGIALPGSGGPVAGGTVSNPFNVTFSGLTLADYDTGGGTSNVNLVGLALPGSGGPVIAGTPSNPLTVTPKISSGGNLRLTLTNGTSTFLPFGDQACSRLLLINATGQTVEFQRGGAGDAVPLLNGMTVPIEGLTNANQISVKRSGVNNAGEVVGAVWEA